MLHEMIVEAEPVPAATAVTLKPQEPKAWGLFRAEGLEDAKFEASGHTLETLKQWASILPDGPKPEAWTQYGAMWEAPTVYVLWTIKEITCLP